MLGDNQCETLKDPEDPRPCTLGGVPQPSQPTEPGRSTHPVWCEKYFQLETHVTQHRVWTNFCTNWPIDKSSKRNATAFSFIVWFGAPSIRHYTQDVYEGPQN
ncbi:uncharacterized protein LOC128299102 [Anopheles moucheti]|uniref:uncharacterized protein LOC128299102 n=1 Tax=Anopheles moucheti TaxID=186751 RepID=UPI0022F02425|nr:uncharacterized protein LOC128299102 [Anopheles moucheti]